jgi:hypothetical protein
VVTVIADLMRDARRDMDAFASDKLGRTCLEVD